MREEGSKKKRQSIEIGNGRRKAESEETSNMVILPLSYRCHRLRQDTMSVCEVSCEAHKKKKFLQLGQVIQVDNRRQILRGVKNSVDRFPYKIWTCDFGTVSYCRVCSVAVLEPRSVEIFIRKGLMAFFGIYILPSKTEPEKHSFDIDALCLWICDLTSIDEGGEAVPSTDRQLETRL